MSKSSNKEDDLRKRMYAFLDLHPKENKTFIINHFRMENVPKSTMYDILQRKENNIGPERKVGSDRTAKKMPKKQIKFRKLVALFRKKIIIIDDESYFPLSNSDLSENAGFYTSDLDATPNEVKLKRKSKYEPKLLVWIALSEKGVSKYYIAPSGQAVNENVYISKCLVK